MDSPTLKFGLSGLLILTLGACHHAQTDSVPAGPVPILLADIPPGKPSGLRPLQNPSPPEPDARTVEAKETPDASAWAVAWHREREAGRRQQALSESLLEEAYLTRETAVRLWERSLALESVLAEQEIVVDALLQLLDREAAGINDSDRFGPSVNDPPPDQSRPPFRPESLP